MTSAIYSVCTIGLRNTSLNVMYNGLSAPSSWRSSPHHTILHNTISSKCVLLCFQIINTSFGTTHKPLTRTLSVDERDNTVNMEDEEVNDVRVSEVCVSVLVYYQNKQNMYWTSRCEGICSRHSMRNPGTFFACPSNTWCDDVRVVMYGTLYIYKRTPVVWNKWVLPVWFPRTLIEMSENRTIWMCCCTYCPVMCSTKRSGGALCCTALCCVVCSDMEWCAPIRWGIRELEKRWREERRGE